MADKKLVDVAHVTIRGTSLRVTVPKKVAKEMGGLGEGDIIVFYKDNGRIVFEKMKVPI